MQTKQTIKSKIRNVADWPKPGINFKDITPLLEDKRAFNQTINSLAKFHSRQKIDKIVGIDARGFILASALAYKLKTGLVIVRKKGKLPSKTVSSSYDLEYGSNTIEIHQDSIKAGEKTLIVDDVLATGGTMAAAAALVKKLGGKIVAVDFLIELSYLKGRKSLKGKKINSLIKYAA